MEFYTKGRVLRQGRSELSELLCLSRRADKERVATARPGAQKTEIINYPGNSDHIKYQRLKFQLSLKPDETLNQVQGDNIKIQVLH